MSEPIKEEVEEKTQTQTQTQNQNQTIPREKVEFWSNDVVITMNIIDVASSRGCFRGPEMKGVGEFYEKLQKLLPKPLPASE